MEFAPFWISAAGMGFGAFLGLRGIVDPHWAAKLVRLKQDGPGGFSEFRATFGGLFFASQAVALVFMVAVALEVEDLNGVPTHWTAMGAAAVCGAMWIGTALARLISLVRDRTDTPWHRVATGVEFLLGLVVLTPWLV